MAKLYFRYGTVSSAKTLNLLAVAHNYRQQNKSAWVVKPAFDKRFGVEEVRSRAGLIQKADIIVSANETVLRLPEQIRLHCILVDEVHFMRAEMVDSFRQIAAFRDIPVICYGVRSDFRGELFPATKRLFELADALEEVKTTCTYCNRKATMSLKSIDGKASLDGPQSELGAEEKFLPACYRCYVNQHAAAADKVNQTFKA